MSSNRYKILIIEDETNICNFVGTILETNDYQVLKAKSGEEGNILFASHCPDLVILDLGLPDMDGLDFIKSTRESSNIPIIVLSARTDENDKVTALDLGANDYVTKPFGSKELMARVRSALRNRYQGMESDGTSSQTFVMGELRMDYAKRKIWVGTEEIKLTQTEYNIVALLSRHVGKVLTYSDMIKEVWGWSDFGSVKKLQVNMANIRKKLGSSPGENTYIFNELGVGYRMEDQE